MSISSPPPSDAGPSPAISTRRAFLGGAGAVVAAMTVPGAAAHAAAPSARFAVVTDTHVNGAQPSRTADLARVMAHIDARNPGFVVNCGDITDHGAPEDVATYLSCIPERLRDRMHHAVGNHEEQWNADALEAHRATFGRTRYSFDHAGLHLVVLDPLVSQEWAWRFGADQLAFLEADLAAVPAGTPVVVFNHLPVRVGDTPFAQDADDLARVVERHPVRAVFAGHTHRLAVSQWNGLTQIVGAGLISTPVYLWAEVTTVDGSPVLQVAEVAVPADAAPSERVVATVPLHTVGPGADLRPRAVHARAAGTVVDVEVVVPSGAPVGAVYARLHPQGGPLPAWVRLAQRGTRWSGHLDITALPPGPHRVMIRSGRGDGVTHDSTTEFTVPTGATRVAWTHQLDERLQGDLAVDGDLVVAGSVSGQLTALTVTPTAARQRWSRTLGGIYKGARFVPDGTALLVGSADHHLYRLDRATGRTVWRIDLGAPVTCDLALVEVDRMPRAVVAAGSVLWCLDLTGAVVWRADLGGTFTGQASGDGERIHAASSNGNAHGFDARTGERLWSRSCTDREDPYGRTIYGPWAARLRHLPDGAVLVTTFTSALALDQVTGEVRWSFDGLRRGLYTPPTVTEHGVLVFDGADGTAHLLDPESGEPLWTDSTLARSFGAGPMVHRDGTVSMVANNGTLARFDLAARTAAAVLQVSTAFTTSTAALVDEDAGFVVAAAKDGMLRGIVGLGATG